MQGLHLTADLRGCAPAPLLCDSAALRALCLAEVQAAGLTPVGELFHPFGAGQGVTGAVLRNLKTSQTERSQKGFRRLELAKQQVLQDTVAAAKVTRFSGGVMYQAPSRLIKRH